MGYSIIQTEDSGFVFTGFTLSNNGDVSGNHGASDIWVVKTSQTGVIEWQKCLGGSNQDEGYSIIATTDSGYLVTGFSSSTNGDVAGNNGVQDVWINKLDITGNIEWNRCYGGSMSDVGLSAMLTGNGYRILSSTSSFDGDVSGFHDFIDLWIKEISLTGDILNSNYIGGSYLEDAHNIIPVSTWGFLITGNTQSTDSYMFNNHGLSDIFIAFFKIPSISGVIFHDLNENGLKDTGEPGIAGHMVKMEPGPVYTYSNNQGIYYFHSDTGNRVITYVQQGYWHSTVTPSYSIYVDSTLHQVDTCHFGIIASAGILDVAVSIIGSPVVAGFTTNYFLNYQNHGTITTGGTIQLDYDPLLTYNSSSMPPLSQSGNSLVFEYDTLAPGVQRNILITFDVPVSAGDTLVSTAVINPLSGDVNTINNFDSLQQIIVSGFDPNDKLVEPAGYEQWGFIEHGERLTYTVRFQNTGTWTTYNVIIRDTIDASLDLGTLQIESYSHHATWQLNYGRELVFTFDSIMLPHSSANEPASHGFIRYSVSPLSPLADYTEVHNTAYIYFDFNLPVETNTTVNTFVTNIPVAAESQNIIPSDFLVFPNPAVNFINFGLNNERGRVNIYDNTGRCVESISVDNLGEGVNISHLNKGYYQVRIETETSVFRTGFVK